MTIQLIKQEYAGMPVGVLVVDGVAVTDRTGLLLVNDGTGVPVVDAEGVAVVDAINGRPIIEISGKRVIDMGVGKPVVDPASREYVPRFSQEQLAEIKAATYGALSPKLKQELLDSMGKMAQTIAMINDTKGIFDKAIKDLQVTMAPYGGIEVMAQAMASHCVHELAPGCEKVTLQQVGKNLFNTVSALNLVLAGMADKTRADAMTMLAIVAINNLTSKADGRG